MPICAARAVLLGLLLAGATHAQDAAVTASTTPVIHDIRVERLDIFDPRVPGENFWLFRAANKIHALTREAVIRRELLIYPGKPWNHLRSIESERNLRFAGYFRVVEISSSPRADGKIDVKVRTQDSWTTLAQLSIGTEGGDNFYIFGIEEHNLLGYNKTLGFIHSQVGPVIRNRLRYYDPRLLNSRYQLSTFYGTNPKGETIGVEIKRPFFSLETPWAMDMGWTRRVSEILMFQDAMESTRFVADMRTVMAAAGRRLNEGNPDFTHRAQAGWHAERTTFAPTDGTRLPLPTGREFSGPTLGYSWVQAQYVKETYINRMERVEDFNLGNELSLLGGFMPVGAGSDRDRLIFNAMDQQGLGLGPGRFLLSQIGIAGRSAAGKVENAVAFANANLFFKIATPWPQTLAVHSEVNLGRRLDGENLLVLGGNNGLRGYRNYSFAGSRSLLFNVEDRVFFPGEFFHFFRLGAAAFFDAGAVAPEGARLGARLFHSDVGFGLRFSSTRSTGGQVMRVDVAYAMDPPVGGGSRWVFSVRGGQAFSLFNSSSRLVRQSPGSTLGISPPSDPLSPR